MFSVYSQGGRRRPLPRYLLPSLWPGWPMGKGVLQGTYPLPIMVRMGRGVPQGTYPPPRYLPPPDLEGGTPRYLNPPTKVPTPLPIQVRMGGGGTPRYLSPWPRYLPSLPDRTAYGVLDMLQSVCLFHSHRRTFLFLNVFTEFSEFRDKNNIILKRGLLSSTLLAHSTSVPQGHW